MRRFLEALSTKGSIRRKISLALLVAIVLVFPPIMGAVDLAARRSIENKVQDERRTGLKVDAQAVSKPLYDYDYANVRRLADVIAARGDVDRVEVSDQNGGIVAAAPIWSRRAELGEGHSIGVTYPTLEGQRTIGELRIWFNSRSATSAMRDFHHQSSLALVAALAVIFTVLMIVLRQVMLKPLSVLTDAIDRSEGAGGGFMAEWNSRDEMGRLVSHFNAMQRRRNLDAAKLKAAAANFSTLYNQTPAMLFSLDEEGRIVDVSDYWVNETGYSRKEALGRQFVEFLHDGDDCLAGFEERRRFADRAGDFGRWNCKFRKKDGSVIDGFVAEALAPLQVSERQRSLLIMVDISELKRAEAQLLCQARTDSLTGLPNRRHFKERLGDELERAEAAGDRVNVFFIDLDRFKWINDNLGHHAGDEVLERCAGRITEILPKGAFFARLGGDEFAIFTGGEDEDAASLSRAINVALSEPFRVCGSSVNISASIGVAAFPKNADDVGDLLRAADLAMYRAKRAGRSGFKNYEDSIGDEARRLFDIEGLMKAGAVEDRFYLDYQPVLRLFDQKIIGAEGLLRMRDASGAIVSPGDFIPVAEETGMMPELGAFALERGLHDFRDFGGAASRLAPRLAINLSPVQVSEDLPEQVTEILKRCDFPASRLVLEITESVFLKQEVHLLAIFDRLKSLGCRLALDDFGTGYSSLSYLNDFPIDILKFDRSFVRRLDGDGHPGGDPEQQKRARALLQGVATIAQDLKLETVAEGIETGEQLRLVREMGVDYGQGFIWSKPVPLATFKEVLDADAMSGAQGAKAVC